VREMEMQEKIAPKRNRFGIYGHPLGATTDRPVSYIFWELFSGTFPSQTVHVFLYFEAFKSDRAASSWHNL